MVKFWSNSLKNSYFCLAICSWYFPNIQIISRGCNILIANHVTTQSDFSTGPRDFLSALGTKLGLKGHKESLEGAEAMIWAPKHVKLTDLLFGLIKNIWNNQSKLDLKWFLHEFVIYIWASIVLFYWKSLKFALFQRVLHVFKEHRYPRWTGLGSHATVSFFA